jgi:hypothetical protein
MPDLSDPIGLATQRKRRQDWSFSSSLISLTIGATHFGGRIYPSLPLLRHNGRMNDAAIKDDAAAIDRAHLDHMTLGDRALAHEVLALFDLQAAALLARMAGATAQERSEMAHALKGSARGIGAWRVADASALFDHGHGDATALAALDEALAQARAEIAHILKAG